MFRTYDMIIGQGDLEHLEHFTAPEKCGIKGINLNCDIDDLLNIAVQNLIEDIDDKGIENVIWDYVMVTNGGFIPDGIKRKFRNKHEL